MPLTELEVKGYRSIADLTVPLKLVNVLVGPNGCGKSNLYQSMALIWEAAHGRLAQAVAREGGMQSIFFAGPREANEITLAIRVDDLKFSMTIGVAPSPFGSMFVTDPAVKAESLVDFSQRAKVVMMERGTGTCYIRDRQGVRQSYHLQLRPEESVIHQISDPFEFPHLTALRNRLQKWRFYHQFRTDADSPLRQPQVPVRTFIMASDGRDVALALRTIQENGNDSALKSAVAEAFDGAKLVLTGDSSGLQVGLDVRGIPRTLIARELSDGTLRYLCLLAALMSPTPPPLIALNEPESSLHPQMLEPLARLIVAATEHSQIWLTTHSTTLAEAISQASGAKSIQLVKIKGETMRQGRTDKRVYYSAEHED